MKPANAQSVFWGEPGSEGDMSGGCRHAETRQWDKEQVTIRDRPREVRFVFDAVLTGSRAFIL